MRVLIAPDCFTGTLTAAQAAASIADGWARHAPGDDLALCPLSDGGPGFVDTLHESLGARGRLEAVTVTGPLGVPVPATILVVDDPADRAEERRGPVTTCTAYVETAQACGLHLVPAERRDPTITTTTGVGELLEAALATGAGRIVVGLGGSATNDGGAGMLAALGAGPAELLGRGGAGLIDLPTDALTMLLAVRGRFAGVHLAAASDVDVPLLGFHGASAGFAAQKGATPEQAQALEAALGRFAQVAQESLGVLAGAELLAAGSARGAGRRLTSTPGAGAAGGLGFGLLLLGAERVGGASAVLDALDFDRRLTTADLVVTGEGKFDWQSLRGKVVSAVAQRALGVGVPTIVIAGQVDAGRRESLAVGIESSYAVAESAAEVEAALADPAGTLAARARRVARTWSR